MTNAQILRQDAQVLRARAATMAQAIHRGPLVAQADAKDARAAAEELQVWATDEVLQWNLTGWARNFKGARFTMDRAQKELRRLQDRQPHAVARMSVANLGV